MIEKRTVSEQSSDDLKVALETINDREKQKKELSNYTIADLSDPKRKATVVQKYGLLQKAEQKVWSLQVEAIFND
ncbi:MAG TPA: hypothetical protein DDW71_00635 [Lactobacillus sp.]|nr:hypothetical protein [Lactobacillus sp.]